MNRGRHVARGPRSAWTLPLIAFVALTTIVVVGTVLAVMFS